MISVRQLLRSDRYRRLSKEGFWVVAGQAVAMLGSLVLVRVLTEYLEPAQYGQLALGLTVAGLVNQVVMGGVAAGVGRFYSVAVEKQDLGGFLHASWRLMSYATLVALIMGSALLGGLLFLDFSQWIGLAAVALVFSVLSGYNSALNGLQNAARQRAVVAFHGGVDAWLKILLAIGVMVWLGYSSTSVVVGYALSSLLVTGSQFIFLRRLIPRQTHKGRKGIQWMGRMWTYSWPFSTWGIFTWLQQSSDRWTLDIFSSTEDVGLYVVLFQLGYAPISIASGVATNFLGPILFQRSGEAMDRSRNADVHLLSWRITISCLLLTLVGFLLSFGLHEWIFRLLVASKYRAVSYLLPWVVMAGGMFATGQVMALKLLSDMRPTVLIRAKIVTAIIGVALNVYGASVFGLRGIVGALVGFSFIYFIWVGFLVFANPRQD